MRRLIKALASPRSHRASFTLVELIVAMAIIVILAAVSVTQFRHGQAKQDLRIAADELTAAWQELQTRALAGANLPADQTFYDPYTYSGTVSYPASASQGYGLLLFGPYRQSTYMAYLFDIIVNNSQETGGWHEGFLSFVGCAIPHQPYLENNNILPLNFEPEVNNGFDAYMGSCFFPLRQYLPALPRRVVVRPESISLGPRLDQLYPLMVNSGGMWSMTSINYETCQPSNESLPVDIPSSIRGAVFVGIKPPAPTYYVNGRPGCKIIQFALTNLDNLNVALWMRIDLNTGRISYYDSPPPVL